MDARVYTEERTIYVDLDGTLIRSDLLWESLFLTARHNPRALLQLPRWLFGGKARLKAELARVCDLDPELLPYRDEVVERLRAEKAKGRRIVLATAANERLARAVADHLGLFDEVIASDDRTNLKASVKLERILAESEPYDFEYYGNSYDDICLFDRASEATVVAPDRSADRWQRQHDAKRIDDGGSTARAALRAMRPHQWLKNLLVFVPAVLAHEVLMGPVVVASILAFVSFSAAASAVYLVNDLLDLKSDRQHSTKRTRPFASGRLSIPTGIKLAAALVVLSVGIAALLPWQYALILGAYLIATTAYSVAVKRMLLLDVITLAGLYTTRVLAGTAATGIETSFWLLAFSIFFFLSLAMVKRFTELREFGMDACRAVTGRGYRGADIETIAQAGLSSGFAAVMVLALYVQSPQVADAYNAPFLIWLLCPLVLYIIVRIWILARRDEMHEDPIVFILRDWRSQLMIGLGGVLFLGAIFVQGM